MTHVEPELGHGRLDQAAEDALARLRERIGVTVPIEEPYLRFANPDSIAHVARGLGDANPLYLDPGYASRSRYGALVAPPAWLYGVAWGSWDLRRGQYVPGLTALHSGDHWQFVRPVLDGDCIRASKALLRLAPLGQADGAPRLLQSEQIRFVNQREELVAVQVMSTIRVARAGFGPAGRYVGAVKASYSADQIAAIDAGLLREAPRGAQSRYWEDVAVGDPLAPVVKGPLTATDMIAWIQAIGSPHVRTGRHWRDCREQYLGVSAPDAHGIPQPLERVHWDEGHARAEGGLPSAFDYGAQRGGYATYFATLWAGDDGWVCDLDVQYRGMVFYGDVFWITGEVTGTWRGVRGTGFVRAAIKAVNDRGENVMPGTVTFALPSRQTGPVRFPVETGEVTR
jgi:acyl dehydratase